MNKKTIIISASTAAILLAAGGGYFAYQQHDKSLQKKAVDNFVTSFEKKDFDKLATTLSKKSVKDQGLDQKKVSEKYDSIFNGLGIAGIKGNIENLSKKEFNLSFNMTTPFGKLEKEKMTGKLIKEDGQYLIDWNYSLIFSKMEKGNKVYISSEPPKRGEIQDVNKQPLATEHAYPQFGIIPNKLGEGDAKKQALAEISKKFDMTEEQLMGILSQEWVKEDSFVPIKIVDFNEELEKYETTGISNQTVNKRYYPLAQAGAQLIGYTGKTTAEEIEKDQSLTGFDEIGKTGLEAQFDKALRGKTGGKIEIVDENGEFLETLIEQKKQDGKDIQLTIDRQIQKSAFEALDNLPGSTVVTTPTNGQLKAIVSSPSYDPNKFVLGMSQKEYDSIAKDPLNPFLARFGTGYAPGSTFKAITAAIGIDEKVTTPEKTHEISGLKWQKDGSWGDYFVTRITDAATVVNMDSALIHSDNIYFAQEALEIGKDKYLAGLKKFPFGEKMNVHIPMTPAQISNDEIKSEILLADTSYGQGQLLINPIQQAVMYSAFANQGNVVYPQILVGEEVKQKEGVVSKSATELVTNSLIKTVEDENGTAHPLATGDNSIAAKTGTAEIKEKQDTKGQENSFVLAYDAKESKYLVVSMIEDAKDTSAVSKNKEFIHSLK
ncbi:MULTISPECIES: penicillin-binding transpeptidase domain-containing protein [Vagococcus]|uniref:Cell division protein FtsI [Peptidoglycan synthetase] n=1 Tax=Vagococcus fluvialis bH819 TaxID=1255619 RepID=A0A1X6WND4_9ENTE|nr:MULTISPECIES: penicillin-binding transpeptidase domain-containing protein [Vagococcus]SLM85777.1 Cell division protein FtsI [Peptidoglycan synthetase] [Vagococcus fluvialis bH819]HCM90199.1 penicillin-binding transpeptidase domain-containing protein [Vagococcus sp.]